MLIALGGHGRHRLSAVCSSPTARCSSADGSSTSRARASCCRSRWPAWRPGSRVSTGRRRSVSPTARTEPRRAAAPVLLTLFGPTGSRAPAFAAAAVRGHRRVRLQPTALARPADGGAGAADRGHHHRGLGLRDRRHHLGLHRVPGQQRGRRARRPRPHRASLLVASWADRRAPASSGRPTRRCPSSGVLSRSPCSSGSSSPMRRRPPSSRSPSTSSSSSATAPSCPSSRRSRSWSPWPPPVRSPASCSSDSRPGR